MGLLTPIFLSFLSLISVLILFYFFKKQFDEKVISSTYLWEQTVKEWETNRWWKKLQRNLLLLLQLLFMLLLIFALTRPYVTGKGVSGEHLVMIFDTSASMAAETEAGSRLEVAKQEAFQLLDKVGNEQQVTVIANGNVPRLVVTKENDAGRIKSAIEALTLSYQHNRADESLQLGQSLLRNQSGEIHMFTDALTKQALQKIQLTKNVTVHNIENKMNNISLQAFGVRSEGNAVSAIVTLKNQGDSAETVTVTISHDEQALQTIKKQVAASMEQTFTIKGLPQKNYYKAVIHNNDSYMLDNRRFAFLSQQQPSTLYVTGEVNPFLIKAFQYTGTEVVTVPKDEQGNYRFPEKEHTNNIYVLSGVPTKQWPKGSKLILSPTSGGPFQIKEKTKLKYRLQKLKNDPLLRFVNIEETYLGKAYAIGDTKNLTSLVKSGEQTVVAKGLYHGSPTVLLAFDIQDSDWPLHPGFPVLIQNTIGYLSQQQETLGYFLPGEQQKVILAPTVTAAKVETQDGKDLDSLNLSDSVLTAPLQPGLYQLNENTTNGSITRYFAVMLDDRELTGTSAQSFSLQVQDDEQAATMALVKYELWRWLAALALLILLTEWEVYRRGVSSR